MGSLKDMILAYFDAQNWQVQEHETEPYVRFEYGNETGSWVCLIWHIEELSQILIYALHPQQVPTERRGAVAEFLTRVNYGQTLGCFEMNFEDGELRYRTCVDFGAGEVGPEPFVPALQMNLLVYGDHLPALEDVISGRAVPEDAARAVHDDDLDLDLRDDGY